MKIFNVLFILLYLVWANVLLAADSSSLNGFWITPSSVSQNLLRVKPGDTHTFEGDICVTSLGGDNQNCLQVSSTNYKLVFSAYFPDSLHNVSDKIVITQSNDKKSWHYKYKTNAIVATDLNQFTLTVGTGDQKTTDFLSIKAKLEKRISILKDFNLQYSGKREYAENVKYNINLINYLQGLIAKIDIALQNNPDILAQIRIPVRVNNSKVPSFLYTSNFSGYILSLKLPVGNLFEGDKANIEASVTNLSDKLYYFPVVINDQVASAQSNNTNTNQSFRISINLDGKSLVANNFSGINLGATQTFNIVSPILISTNTNKLGLSFVSNNLSNSDSSNNLIGMLSYAIPVIKNTPPIVVLNCLSSKIHQINCDANGSKDIDGNINSLTYLFDDGITVTTTDPASIINHVFKTSGGHTVSLMATDNDNGVTTVVNTFQIKANGIPVADFNCISNIMFQVSCTSLAYDSDAPDDYIKQTVWDFGDGVQIDSMLAPQVHTYATGGNQTITLTVYDNFGASSHITKVIAVKDNLPPIASINCITKNMLVQCNGIGSYDPEGQQISFKLDFGDGTQESNLTGFTTHAYLQPGSYTVKMYVADSLGATTIATTKVQPVLPPNILPIASLNCNSDRPFAISCDATGSSDQDGHIVSYKYQFDDGQLIEMSSAGAINSRFSTSGNHTIALTVIDNDGGATVTSKSVAVKANTLPIVAFTCEPNYLPQKIKCKSTSYDSDIGDSISNLEWRVDGSVIQSGTSNEFDYATTSVGDLSITLMAADTLGGQLSATQKYTIVDSIAPVISFQYPNNYIFNASTIQSFYIQVNDNEKINFNSVELSINGNKIPTQNYSIDSINNKINVVFTVPSLMNLGNNLFTAKVLNSSGNQTVSSIIYVLSDTQAPIISVSPVDGTHFTTQNGDIVVTFDNSNDADWSSLSIQQDGADVDPSLYKIVGNQIILSVASGNLFAGGDNVFSISLSDKSGNIGTKTAHYFLDSSSLSFDFIPENRFKFDLASNSISIYPIDDTNALNWNSLKIYINGQLIDSASYTINSVDGKVSLPVTVSDAPTVVKIEMADGSGKIIAGESSYFLRDTIPPVIAFNIANLTEFQNDDRPYIFASSVDASAINYSSLQVTLNGGNVPAANYSIDSFNNKIYFKFDSSVHPIIGDNTLEVKVSDSEGNLADQSLVFRLSDTEAPMLSMSPAPGSSFYSDIVTITTSVQDMSEINWQSLSIKVNGVPAPLLNYYVDTNTIILNLNEDYSFELGANTVSIDLEDIWGNHRSLNTNYNLLEKRSVQLGFSPDRNSHFKNATPTTKVIFNFPANVDWTTVKFKINDTLVSSSNFSKINGNTVSLNFTGNYFLVQGLNKLAVEYLDISGNTVTDSLAYFLDDIYAPTLSLLPGDNTFLKDQNLNFSFSVSDAGGVNPNSLIMTLNGSEVNANKYSFSGTMGSGSLKLNPGTNKLTLSISDKVGNIAKVSQNYIVGDSIGPTYSFNPISWSEFNDSSLETFNITLNDLAGVDESSIQLWLNSVLVPSSKYSFNLTSKILKVSFDNEFGFKGGNNIVKIRAADTLGHFSEQNVTYKLVDTTGPSINFTPSSGASYSNNNAPEIKVQFSDVSDILVAQASVYLNDKLLTSVVDYSIDTANKQLVLSFNGTKLTTGNNNIRVEVQDSVGNKSSSTAQYQLIDTLPPAAAVTPAIGTAFYNQNQSIVVSLSDISTIDWSTLIVMLNGQTISSSNINTLGNSFSIQFGDLLLFKEGVNTISYRVSDSSGNQLSSSIQYTMNDIFPSEFSFDPISGTEINTINKIINIAITDGSPLNWGSLAITLNGQVLPSSYYSILGNNVSLALNGNFSLRKGLNRVEISIKDDKGNLGKASAAYIVNPASVDLNPPQVAITPSSGMITSVPSSIVITSVDESGIDFTKYQILLNGQVVPSKNLRIDSASGNIVFTPDSTTVFNPGRNILSAFVADNYNNLGGKSVFYDLMMTLPDDVTPPIVTFSPAGGELVSNTPTIVAYLSDASGIDYSSLQILLNESPIDSSIVVIDKNKVTLQFTTNHVLPNSISNKITIIVRDLKGNSTTAAVGFDQLDAVTYKIVNFINQMGLENCVILDGGNVRCWGLNNQGQLGQGDVLDRSSMIPSEIPVISIGEAVKGVSANGSHACALTVSGKVMCWGVNNFGQLGYGNTNIIGDDELPRSAGFVDVGELATQITVGASHTCALLVSGNVKCWGSNAQGQLGQISPANIGDNELPSTMPNISLGENATQVVAGMNHTCVLLQSGKVRCFGEMLAVGIKATADTLGSLPSDLPVLSLSGKVKQLSSHGIARDTCALLVDGNINCWGDGSSGVLGYGNQKSVGVDQFPSEMGVVSVGGSASKVVVGPAITCALLTNHKLSCWGQPPGNGHEYMLGIYGPPTDAPYVDYGPGVMIDINIGQGYSCGTFDDGSYKCWGYNYKGDLGYGNIGSMLFINQSIALAPVSLGGKLATINGITAYFDISSYYGPSPLTITFDASKSSSQSTGINNYHWDFGDGIILDSTQKSIDHIYNKVGVYRSLLTITDANNNTTSFQRTITVGPTSNPPFAFFTAATDFGVVPFNARFDGSGTFDINGTISNYYWKFGDGNLQSTVNPSANHTYNKSGAYLVMMSAENSAGQSSEAFPLVVTVKDLNMAPFASFTCSTTGKKINCNAYASGDLDGSIIDYKWNFGDQTVVYNGLNLYEVSHAFAIDGNYNVQLTVTDNNGATANFQVPVLIDTVAPYIIANLADNVITNNSSYLLALAIDELNNVETTVSLNGQAVLVSNDHIINSSISLNEGLNTISVVSIDGSGNKTSKLLASNIVLDTVAPTLASLTPTNGDEVKTPNIVLKGAYSEKLSALTINGNPVVLSADGKSFTYNYIAYTEGTHEFVFYASDMAGNTNSTSSLINVQLKILNPELVAIQFLSSSSLKIIGSPGAVKANAEVSISSGFFNSSTVSALPNGSFEMTLNYFTSAKITATDLASSRSESAQLNYNVDTTLAGTILDTDGNPLPGVKVIIKNTDVSPVTTNASGMFSFSNPPTGDRQVIIDAQGVPAAAVGPNKKFSVLEIPVSIGTRQANVLTTPIYLAPLMFDGTETPITDGVGTTVESPQVAGAAIEIPGSVQVNFPEGNTVKAINMAEVVKEKTTVPVLKQAEPQSVVALEPSGLSFSEPVKLTLPNTNEFPAGMQVMIYSKNSKTGTWEIDGVAKVDGTGSNIVTQPGMGITHFSEVYAAPMGLKYSQINSQDKPGADTFNGAVSTSIDFPGYKSLGSEIAPKLLYRSNWAHPTATVTNIFDVPSEVQMISSEGKRILAPISGDLGYIKTWVVPESVDLTLIAGDYHSPLMSMTGIPNKAVVSLGVDFQNQNTGIIPFAANYEIHLKRMIVRTEAKGAGNILDQRIAITETPAESFPESIPAELRGQLYIQNKSKSFIGRGWMIGGVQKIVNPGSSRVMLEEDSGAITTYVTSDKIQTVAKIPEGFAGLNAKDLNQVIVAGNKNDVYDLDLDTGTKSVLMTAPQYSGTFRTSRFYSRYECSAWTNAPWPASGTICFAHATRFYCQQKTSNFTLLPTRNYAIQSPNGNGYILASEHGVISLGNEIAGKLKPAPSSDSDLMFCSNSATCSGERIINDFRSYPACPPNPIGSGLVYDQGFDDGPMASARFNTIKSLSASKTSNSFAVADFGNHRVRLVNLDTKIVVTIAGNGKTEDSGDGGLAIEASLYHPLGTAYDGNGNLYVSTENGYIRKIDTSGKITKIAGNPNGVFYDQAKALDMYLSRPYGLAFDDLNNYLYVADTGNNRVLRIDLATGIAKNVAGNNNCQAETPSGETGGALNASLCNPEFISLDDNKNLVVADAGHKMIRRVIFSDSASGAIKYDSVADDGSSLLRNLDGSFVRIFRSGVKINFDMYGKHISSVDRLGRTTTNIYDSSDKLVQQNDPVGGKIYYDYATFSGLLQSIRYSADGRQFNFNYDIDNNLSSVTYPDGTTKQFDYASDGLLLKETDQRNFATSYTYNSWNRLQEVTRPDGKKITLNDSQSGNMANNYTGGIKGPLKTQGTDAGQLVDGIKDAKGITTSFVQDESGYVSSIIDGAGKITTVARDLKGRPILVTRPDASIVAFTYDQKTGDLLSKTDSATGTSESYIYDAFGNLLTKTDGLGRRIINTYDNFGQLIKTTNEILGTSATYTYNLLGLLIKQTDALGNSKTVVYNAQGNVVSSFAANGAQTHYTYYPSGLLQKITDANLTNVIYEYDTMNRLISVVTGENKKTTYTYQETGELIQIADPYNKITSFYYDIVGQMIKKVGSRGEITQMAYDENGNLISEISPNGQSKFFYYDNLNQLTRKLLPDEVYNFAYDVRGNVSSISNTVNQIDFEYDHYDDGDIISKTHSYGIGSRTDLPNITLNYQFNNMGEKTAMVTPLGTFQYGRDAAGRLRSITNHKGDVFSFKYDLNNNLSQISTPTYNSTVAFDTAGFSNQINYARKSGASIERFIYSRDSIGNRLSKTTMAGTSSYSYDKNYQLLQALTPNLPDENFSYDAIGNRVGDSNGSFTYDESGQQLKEDSIYIYAYDTNGNLFSKTEKLQNGNIQTFNFNSCNQLKEMKLYKAGQLTKEAYYIYDALGRRIEKNIIDHENVNNSYVKRFAYDANEILFELDGVNTITSTYTNSTLRTDDVLAVANSQGSYYYVKDGLGTVTDITDEAGFKIQHYDYSSFGVLLRITDVNGNDISANPKLEPYITFTGREFDKESDLYYFRARYYDPNTGRFLSVDPSPGRNENPNSVINKYIYVENDPVNKYDQNGDDFSTTDKAGIAYIISSKLVKRVPVADYGEWCGLEVAPAEHGKDPAPHNNLDRNCMAHDKELLEARDRRSIWEQGYGSPITAQYTAGVDFAIYQASRTVADLRLGFNMLNDRNWDGKPLKNPTRFSRGVVMGGYFIFRGVAQNLNLYDLTLNGISWGFSKNGQSFVNGQIKFYKNMYSKIFNSIF